MKEAVDLRDLWVMTVSAHICSEGSFLGQLDVAKSCIECLSVSIVKPRASASAHWEIIEKNDKIVLDHDFHWILIPYFGSKSIRI